ncbi:MAG: sensor histidine kinase N-terminal domain-containing protein, partial [Alphaproteobacteria bacterium]
MPTTDFARPDVPRRRVPSLTLRLGVAISLILLAGGAAVTLAALAYGRQAAQEAYDRILLGAANQIAAAVTIREGRVVVDLPVSAFELLALAGDDRIAYRVIGANGETVTGYDTLKSPPIGLGDIAFQDAEFGGEAMRLTAVRRRFAERAFSGTIDVVVGHTTQARRLLAWDIAKSALVVVGIAGIAMVVLVAFAIRSALRPLRRIESGLAGRDPRDLTPLDVAVPAEIGSFVVAINRFMRRLEAQMDVLQRFIADASHQLRTPVAALRAQAELATGESDPDRLRTIAARIHSRSVGLGRLTDQLLSHALIIHRTDTAPRERIDLRAIAIETVSESETGIEDAAERIRLDLPEDAVTVFGDALSLREACKNLVNNALHYGAPPVTVRVAADTGRASIAVADPAAPLARVERCEDLCRSSRRSGGPH